MLVEDAGAVEGALEVCRIHRAREFARPGAEPGFDVHPDLLGPFLHGVPGETVAAAEIAHDLESTALMLDAEPEDSP